LYGSPIGALAVRASEVGVAEIFFADGPILSNPGKNNHLDVCLRQLDEYFRGQRDNFDVDLDLRGTEFQMSVWRALLLIPYGETASYGRIAGLVGRPKAVRAVGGANHRNPVSIIVPCHRVVGSDGGLTGYGGGLWRKEWLLEHERSHRVK
jgi:methylated-DNA-[protein]-cysteine S-methyltransferase